jgi:hypothetical protein
MLPNNVRAANGAEAVSHRADEAPFDECSRKNKLGAVQ